MIAWQQQRCQVRDLVWQAGQRLLSRQGHYGALDHKSTTELVTDLDREVEAELVRQLASIFPQDAVCAEEGTAHSGSSGRTWYIDPLDGTTNYVHGYPFYAVSVGCADESGPVLGAVYAPYLDELYVAAAGQGAVLERPQAGQSWAMSSRRPVTVRQALLATGFPYVRNEVVDQNTRLVRRFLLEGCHGVRRGGSAAIDLCHVAAGKLDGYWEMKLRPWDVTAGSLIALEAGARVTDFSGRSGLLDGESILAAAPALYERMLEILQEEGIATT
jgi:myo-inositol-1(or 4)-monophosphatase